MSGAEAVYLDATEYSELAQSDELLELVAYELEYGQKHGYSLDGILREIALGVQSHDLQEAAERVDLRLPALTDEEIEENDIPF